MFQQVEASNVRAKVDHGGLQSQLMKIGDDAEVISLRDGICFPYKEEFSELFVRTCYKELFEIILKFSEADGSQGTIVTGNPGIGKSYFLFYCLFRFIKLGKTVVLESSQQRTSWLYRPNEATLIGKGSADEVFREHLRSESTVYLFDPNQNSPRSVRAFTIIAAYPHDEIFHQFFKTKGVNKLYMPEWSRAEVENIPSSSLTFDQKLDLFEKYGGVPRYIETDKKWGQILLRNIDGCKATDVIKTAGYLEKYREFDMILQYVVNDDYQVESVRFASNYVFELLIKNWEARSKEALNLFFDQTKAIRGLREARRSVFEVLSHRMLVNGGTFTTRKLGTTSGSSSSSATAIDTNDFEIGKLKHNYFNHIDEVDFTKNDEYWQPKSRSLTGIDSLALVNNELLLFKMTINEKHGIKQNEIEDIVDVLPQTTSPKLMRVYFVVPEDQFALYPEQKIISKDDTVGNRKAKFVIEQHVLGVALTAQTSI